MKILALDTSSAACSVALLHDHEVKIRHEVVPLRHAKYVLSFIEELLGADSNSLDALAWGCGPGSFTGLRIAASVVQALGFAWQLPVMNVSSLAALAQTAYQEHGWRQQLVAVDARMHEVYCGAYRINDEGHAELVSKPEALCSPQELSSRIIEAFGVDGEWHGVGNGWSMYQAELENCAKKDLNLIDADCLPKALAVAQLGRLKYEKGQGVQSFDALPAYLRDNVYKNS